MTMNEDTRATAIEKAAIKLVGRVSREGVAVYGDAIADDLEAALALPASPPLAAAPPAERERALVETCIRRHSLPYPDARGLANEVADTIAAVDRTHPSPSSTHPKVSERDEEIERLHTEIEALTVEACASRQVGGLTAAQWRERYTALAEAAAPLASMKTLSISLAQASARLAAVLAAEYAPPARVFDEHSATIESDKARREVIAALTPAPSSSPTAPPREPVPMTRERDEALVRAGRRIAALYAYNDGDPRDPEPSLAEVIEEVDRVLAEGHAAETAHADAWVAEHDAACPRGETCTEHRLPAPVAPLASPADETGGVMEVHRSPIETWAERNARLGAEADARLRAEGVDVDAFVARVHRGIAGPRLESWAREALEEMWMLGYDACGGDAVSATETGPAIASDLAFVLSRRPIPQHVEATSDALLLAAMEQAWGVGVGAARAEAAGARALPPDAIAFRNIINRLRPLHATPFPLHSGARDMAIAEAVRDAIVRDLRVSIAAKEARAEECRRINEPLAYAHSEVRQARADALAEECESIAKADLAAVIARAS